jgi:hypothetical protein
MVLRPEDIMEPSHPAGLAPDEQERVPIFGTWRAIYTAVIVSALAMMGLVALFSAWPY